MEVRRIVPQERVQQRTIEQIVDVFVTQVVEQVVEFLVLLLWSEIVNVFCGLRRNLLRW